MMILNRKQVEILFRNATVDIFVTALAASEYNFYYRQIQAKEFAKETKRYHTHTERLTII